MQSLWTTGRLISRALWNFSNTSSSTSTAAEAKASRSTDSHLVSVVSGFAKETSIKKLIKGKFGDDAWFTARHKTSDVLGVADGVGGWRSYGIDPGEFSLHLMKSCERFVKLGYFAPTNPTNLLANGYYELKYNKKSILGSSTACVVVLNHDNNTLHTASIGDSGFMIVRRGRVVHRSEEQQHYFNTPFQLSIPPPGYRTEVIADEPDSAVSADIPVEDGDVILVATDGVFDNLPHHVILRELVKVQGETCTGRLQLVANTIALMARQYSCNEKYMSPFALSAFAHGISTVGGKPDDITVIIATVTL